MEKIICGDCGQIHNKCKAHKRRKKKTDPLVPCNKSPMQNGTCDLHGGKTPAGIASPHFKDGKYSKYLNTSLAEKVRTAATDFELVSVREEIALVTALTEDRLEKIFQGKDVDAWYLMQEKYNEYEQNLKDWEEYEEKKEIYDEKVRQELSRPARRGRKAKSKLTPPKEPRDSAEVLRELGDVIKHGLLVNKAFERIEEMTEHKRRLVETESRRIEKLEQSITAEKAMGIISLLAGIINKYVPDPTARAQISAELAIVIDR